MLVLTLFIVSQVCEFKVDPNCAQVTLIAEKPVSVVTLTPSPTPTGTPVPSPTPKPTPIPEGVIFLKNGTYKKLPSLKDGATVVGESQQGVVILGEKGKPILNQGYKNLTFKKLTFRGGGEAIADNSKAAIVTDDGWKFEDVTIEKMEGVGLSFGGDNNVFRRVLAQDNGIAGLGGKGDNNLVVDSVIRRNNGRAKSDGGGFKFTRSDKMVVRNVEAYENIGPGIWFDVWNTNVTVENCYSHDNKGTSNIHGKGIMLELTGGEKSGKMIGKSVVRNNRVSNNDVISGRSKDIQRGILISSSSNVDVINNNIEKGDTICLKDGKRELKTVGILVKDNKLIDGSKIIYDGAKKNGVKEVNNGPDAPGVKRAE